MPPIDEKFFCYCNRTMRVTNSDSPENVFLNSGLALYGDHGYVEPGLNFAKPRLSNAYGSKH